jgi:hypothetical protein
VVALKRGPLTGPCTRHLTVVTKTIVPTLVERQFDRTVCGDILSVGRDSNTTYLTLRRGERTDIVYAGYGRTHMVLPGHALLAISPASDMLVVAKNDLPPDPASLIALRDRGDVPPSSIFGTALFYRGFGVHPRPYRSGGDVLWIDRVFAWSRDSTTALVAGRLGNAVGVYRITTGPGRRTEPPRWVGPIRGSSWATFSDDGSAFLWTDDQLAVLDGGELQPLPLPTGAPAPQGPIVWLA